MSGDFLVIEKGKNSSYKNTAECLSLGSQVGMVKISISSPFHGKTTRLEDKPLF